MQGPPVPADGIFSPEELKEIENEIAAASVPGESQIDVQHRAMQALNRRLTPSRPREAAE